MTTRRRISATQQHKLMGQLLSKKAGRQRIAASVQEPLRKLRDYSAVGRKAFFIDELPDGAIPVYDMDVDITAFVVGEDGDSVEQVITGSRIHVPVFEIATWVKVKFVQVKERRFDIVNRIKKKAKDEVFRVEDQIIFSIMQQASLVNVNNPRIAVSFADFDLSTFVDAFAEIEKHGLNVDKIYMNPREYKTIRSAGQEWFDPETQKQLISMGYMGRMFGADIIQSVEVPKGELFFITSAEYLGVIPSRIDLTVLPADDPGESRSFGWSVFVNEGCAIHNPLGIQGVKIN